MPTVGQLLLAVIGLLAYATAAVLAILRFRRRDGLSAATVMVPLVVGLLAGAGLIVWRIVAARSLLGVNGFDATVLIAWLIATEVLVIGAAKRLRGVEAFLLPVATTVQAVSLLLMHSAESGPGRMSQWHIIGHAMVISIAGACFVASGVAGVVYLIVHRAMRSKRQLSVLGRLPPLESLERMGRGSVAAGFPLLTFGILTGVCGIAHTPVDDRFREAAMASGTIVLWAVYGIAMLVVWFRPRLRGPRGAALATGAAGLTVLNFVAYLVMRSTL